MPLDEDNDNSSLLLSLHVARLMYIVSMLCSSEGRTLDFVAECDLTYIALTLVQIFAYLTQPPCYCL